MLGETVNLESWQQVLIPLGGFGLLLWLLLQYKLIHPNTLRDLVAEKDKQIDKAEATAAEWKAAYKASEQARAAEHEARLISEQRGDAAVAATQLVADGLDRLRLQLEANPEGASDARAQRRGQRGPQAG